MKRKESYFRQTICIDERMALQYVKMRKCEILLHQYLLSIVNDEGVVKRNMAAAARETGCCKKSLYSAETSLRVRGLLALSLRNGRRYWRVKPVRASDETQPAVTDDESFADEAHDIGQQDIGQEEVTVESKSTRRFFSWFRRRTRMKSKIVTLVLVLFVVILAVLRTCLRQQAPETEVVKPGREVTASDSSEAKPNRQHVPTKTEQRFKVVRVIDGDTVMLDNGERLRYIGIDTPETKHPLKPVEPFGKEASAVNTKLVWGQEIDVEFDVQKRDKYGRLLGYVFLSDGTFVNAELVQRGYAKVYTFPPNVKYSELFLKLQAEAFKNNRGLWR